MKIKTFVTVHNIEELEKHYNKWYETLLAEDVVSVDFQMNTLWDEEREKIITKYALVVLYE